MQTVALIVGLCAVFFGLLSYQFRRRGGIIACSVVSRVLYVAQYVLLGAFEGAVMDLSAIPASMLAARKHTPFVQKHRTFWWLAGNVAVVLIGWIFWENMVSLFAIVGVLFEINALWMTKEKYIRLISLCSLPFWMAYNVLCGAWGSVVGNVLMVISIFTALYRHDRTKV